METTIQQEKRNNYFRSKIERSYHAVEKVRMSENKYAIVNRETGAKLSEVSKRYTLVKNKDVFQPFISRFGIDSINKFYGYGGKNGDAKFYYMEIRTGRSFDFGTDENPDIVEELLCISNSYNKTKSFSFKLGAFRWVCANGLHSGEALVNYKKIHVGEINTIKLVFQALMKYQDNTFDNWKTLKSVPLSKDRRLEIINSMKIFDEKDKNGETIDSNVSANNRIRWSAKRKLEWNRNATDNQENGWGLYNQINHAIESNIGGNSQIDRRVTANKRMEAYLMTAVKEPNVTVGQFLN